MNVSTRLHLRTDVMLGYWTFTCTCAESCFKPVSQREEVENETSQVSMFFFKYGVILDIISCKMGLSENGSP